NELKKNRTNLVLADQADYLSRRSDSVILSVQNAYFRATVVAMIRPALKSNRTESCAVCILQEYIVWLLAE
ncbi:hypothetical protein NL529_27895, partial [Klebsiella pneumoniae]|nr:hypothetical protein [Klebsiella pneumoniae]